MANSETARPDSSPPGSGHLLAEAAHEIVRWRIRRRRTITLSAISAALGPLLIVVLTILRNAGIIDREVGFGIGLQVLLIASLMLLGGLFGLLTGIIMRPRRGSVADWLWTSRDVRAVGPLVEASQMMMPDLTQAAVQSLTRLLPKLKQSDGHILNAYQRECLNRALERAGSRLALGNRPYIHAILNAWVQVGDESAAEPVKALAEGQGMAADDPEMRLAASYCLSAIQQRAERTREPQVLLRAASAESGVSESLLRPAVGTPVSEEPELLRASIGPSN